MYFCMGESKRRIIRKIVMALIGADMTVEGVDTVTETNAKI